jgi:HAD superfamily hydrolase (TIGR01484 family)
MKKLVLFDMDGTLTGSKTPIDDDMASLFRQLLTLKKVAVVSGCSMGRFESQLLSYINLDGVGKNLYLFPALGTSFYRFNGKWEQVYRESLPLGSLSIVGNALLKVTEGFDVPWDKPYGEIMEDRGGQITFSALGQEAPLALKAEWDKDYSKRLEIKRKLEPMLPDFEITVGGTTSISFTRRGVNKAYCLDKIWRYLGFVREDILFVGNAIFEGGDDYALKKAGVYCIGVESPEDTKKVIKGMLARCFAKAR